MRVLHFFKTYYPDSFGGIEQFIFQLSNGMSAHAIKSEVLSLSDNKPKHSTIIANHLAHKAKLDFQIYSMGVSVSVFLQFAKLAKQADIIHYHFPWPFMDIVHFVTRIKKPTIVTYHSDIVRQKRLLKLYQPLMNRFFSSVDHIVATSPNYLETSSILQNLSQKVSVIPIGLDCNAYPKPEPSRLEYWRARVGEHFFLFIGRLRYYKGLHVLINAAAGLKVKIVIVGSGPFERELKMQVSQLKLNNIEFLGELEEKDKVALLTLCFSVVFPSHLRSEAFGIFLLEGAMFGKPMISTEIGTGTTYININEKTGFVVPPSDFLALRHAMQKMLNNPAEAAMMGKHAFERYNCLFTADKMAAQYAKLYREIIFFHNPASVRG